MKTYTVDGVTKTTTKDASLIVLARFEGRGVWSLTRDEETLKQCEYDVKRLGWTDIAVAPFLDGFHYYTTLEGVDASVEEQEVLDVIAADAASTASFIHDLGVCPTCGASGDERCKSSTGKRASKNHANRAA